LRLNDEDKDKESSFKGKDKDKDLMSKDEDKESSFKDKDKDKDLMSKDEDLKIGPRGSSRTRTFLKDNTETPGLNFSNKRPGLLEIQSCQSTSHMPVTSELPQHLPQHKVLTQIAYSVLKNFRGLELPRTRTRTRTCSSRTRTRT